MFKPQDMTSIIITGPKNLQEPIIGELHELKILHIIDHSKSDLADIGKPLDLASYYSDLLVKVRALISTLRIKNEPIKKIDNVADVEKLVGRISGQVSLINEGLKQLDELGAEFEALSHELSLLEEFNIPLESLSGLKSASCFAGFLKNDNNLLSVKKKISEFSKKTIMLESKKQGRPFLLIYVDSKLQDKLSVLLQENGFVSANLTHSKSLKGTAESNLSKVNLELANIEDKRAELSKRLQKLKDENCIMLLAAEGYLSEELEKAEAPLRFASTSSSFLIKGWIPTDDLSKVIDRLDKVGKKKIFVHFDKAKKNDKVPVRLENPKTARPFEFFIDLYSYPLYREIDPTFFVFLTFPIFFGIMLGDVGYGLVAMLIFWIAKKKIPQGARLVNALILSSFVSIIFGFIFGEVFGYEFLHHPIISREHEMMKLMYFAVGLGVVHVNIGLIAGFINEKRSHGLVHAINAKLSWIILQIGAALLALPYVSEIKLSPWIGSALIALSALMLLKGEGVKGLIELPSIFTNILSYARLMAIGLSSVILAVIINDSATKMIHQGGFMIIAGLLILLVGHVINIMLGLFGSFLHSLRLHYVEFFSKFFLGGGKKYSPFGFKES